MQFVAMKTEKSPGEVDYTKVLFAKIYSPLDLDITPYLKAKTVFKNALVEEEMEKGFSSLKRMPIMEKMPSMTHHPTMLQKSPMPVTMQHNSSKPKATQTQILTITQEPMMLHKPTMQPMREKPLTAQLPVTPQELPMPPPRPEPILFTRVGRYTYGPGDVHFLYSRPVSVDWPERKIDFPIIINAPHRISPLRPVYN